MHLSSAEWFSILWPFLVLAALPPLAKIGFEVLQYKLRMASQQRVQTRLADTGTDEIDAMSGEEFEQRLAALFRLMGYDVQVTPAQGDFGADLIVAKDGVRTAVQAKRHNRFVGNKAVQEALAGRAHYGCHRAMVITNSFFTTAAEAQARTANVQLWDRFDLAEALASAASPILPAPPMAAPSMAAAPAPAPVPPIPLTPPPPPTPAPAPSASRVTVTACRTCGGSRLHVQYGRYGYYLKCLACDGNTPIRTDCARCGSRERIRKSGQRFYAECDRCRGSRLYWVNDQGAPPPA